MQRRLFLNRLAQSAAAVGLPGWMSRAHAAEEGLTAQSVNIGTSLSLTGILAGAGQEHTTGIKAAFAAVNQAGGVHGRELRLTAKDDGYSAPRTLENVRLMLDTGSVFALMSLMGTATTAAALPLIELQNVPCVGPVTGASSLRNAAQRNVFHVRASYSDETLRVAQQVVNMGMKDIAVIHLDNPFGKEFLRDANRALASYQVKTAGSFALAPDGSNSQQVVSQVLDARAGAVLLGTTGTATTELLLALRSKATALPIAGISVSVISSELPKLGPAARGLALTQVFPDPTKTKLSAVRRYQHAMRAYGVSNFGGSSFEGWVNAQVLIEGLRRAGRELTRERLRLALGSIKHLDLGEYSLGFSVPAPFVASQFVDLAVLGADGSRVS